MPASSLVSSRALVALVLLSALVTCSASHARGSDAGTPAPPNPLRGGPRQGPVNSTADLLAFVHWLDRHGAKLGSIEIRRSGGGFGVFATAPIAPGEPLARVPRSLVLNEQAALRSFTSPELTKLVLELYAFDKKGVSIADDWVLLKLAVMYEGRYKNNSFWKPYFDILPTSFEGHVNFATQQEIESSRTISSLDFGNGYAQKISDAMADAVLARYPELFGQDTPAQRQLWSQDLKWAFTVVASRVYSPKFKGDTLTLVPLLDMFNHFNGGARSKGIFGPNSTAQLLQYGKDASMRYQTGDEVWASYVKLDEVDSMCNFNIIGWAFTLNDDVNHCSRLSVNVSLPMITSDDIALSAMKLQVLHALELKLRTGDFDKRVKAACDDLYAVVLNSDSEGETSTQEDSGVTEIAVSTGHSASRTSCDLSTEVVLHASHSRLPSVLLAVVGVANADASALTRVKHALDTAALPPVSIHDVTPTSNASSPEEAAPVDLPAVQGLVNKAALIHLKKILTANLNKMTSELAAFEAAVGARPYSVFEQNVLRVAQGQVVAARKAALVAFTIRPSAV